MSTREPPTDVIDLDIIARHAATDTHRAHRSVWISLGAALLLMIGVLLVAVYTFNKTNELAAQQITAAQAAQALQGQVLALGAKPVTQAPTPITGTAGATGATGAAGRGIGATHIVAGDLYVVYTDGTSIDVGQVLGPTGATGQTGRGITASVVNTAGDLVLTYSDGATSDVGHVVGPQGQQGIIGRPGTDGATGPTGAPGPTGAAGRGVVSATVTDGHLLITYTDGTTADVGPVVGPTGATGPTGADGQPPLSWTYTDALGIEHTCSRVDGFDSNNPRYTCS
jgi:hypothetical protein